MYFVYIIYSEKLDKFYVGYSSDIKTRIENYHNQGRSAFNSKDMPWILKYSEEFNTEIEAIRREKSIKKMKSRSYIVSLKEQSRSTREAIKNSIQSES